MFTLKVYLPIIVFFILSVSPNLIATKTPTAISKPLAPHVEVLPTGTSAVSRSLQGMTVGFLAWMSSRESQLLETPTDATKFDFVVTKDGSDNFTSINDAVLTALNNSETRGFEKKGKMKLKQFGINEEGCLHSCRLEALEIEMIEIGEGYVFACLEKLRKAGRKENFLMKSY